MKLAECIENSTKAIVGAARGIRDHVDDRAPVSALEESRRLQALVAILHGQLHLLVRNEKEAS